MVVLAWRNRPGRAHYPEVAGSNPAPATLKGSGNGSFFCSVPLGRGKLFAQLLPAGTRFLPAMRPEKPPASLLLVHGAGSGPEIYAAWPPAFPSIDVRAVDLHLGLEISQASHADYAERVAAAGQELEAPVSLCGWSMGGLAVLQAAARIRPHSVVLIESSPPGEVQGFDSVVAPKPGSFDPEELYGSFPANVAARPESSLARAERKRGISVPSLPCPSLVVSGREFPEERGRRVARLYGSAELRYPKFSHWDLIHERRVREDIAAWLGITRPTKLPSA